MDVELGTLRRSDGDMSRRCKLVDPACWPGLRVHEACGSAGDEILFG